MVENLHLGPNENFFEVEKIFLEIATLRIVNDYANRVNGKFLRPLNEEQSGKIMYLSMFTYQIELPLRDSPTRFSTSSFFIIRTGLGN